MRLKELLTLFLFLTLTIRIFAQLNIESATQSGNWADYYVQNVLLGTGVVAFNATFTGADTTGFYPNGIDSAQIAEFSSANTVVDIPYGLMLSTGSAEAHSGTATNPSPGPFASDGASDPDLAQILPNFTLHNRAVLEFDFVPQGDTIRFKYVFASLEYPGYVCTPYNDVFGFFLSGPGISGPFTNGAVNLALIPGTNTEVSINSVNDIPGGSACSPACPCNAQYFVNNYTAPVDTNVLFGGLTVTLEAVAEVVCGDTYHIKMAIADAGDGALDSGVFLEGGSFTSNLIEIEIETVNGDSTINEGCGTADILFTRGDTTDTSISYLTYYGTATNGVDFALLPDTMVLLPGVQDSVITIAPFADGLNEGMEYITIEAMSVTLCGDTFISTGTMYIYDIPNIVFDKSPDTTFFCPPESLTLWAKALSGGPPPFTYLWNTGHTTDTITTNLSANGGIDTFVIAVQDSCQLTTVYDTILVFKDYEDDPIPDIFNDSLVNCAGEQITLACSTDHGTLPLSYLWSTGDTTSNTTLTVNGSIWVYVTVTDDCGREAVDSVELGVKVPENFTIMFPDTSVYCIGSSLFVNPRFKGGTEPFTYSWDKVNPVYNDDSVITVVIHQDTTLYFWVKDVCGREFNANFFVNAIDVDPLTISLPSQEALCSGTSFTLDPEVSGGLAPLNYSWSTGDSDTVIHFIGSVSQIISLTVTDFCGNETIDQAEIYIPEFAPLQILVSADDDLCYGEEYIIRATATGGAGGYVFTWNSLNSLLTGEVYDKLDSNGFRVQARSDGMHVVRVNDQCGATDEDTISLVVKHCLHIPNVVTPNGDGINDVFYINNITAFDDAHLTIYNRWGQKLYEAKPYKNEWDGSKHPSGTYYYILRSSHFNEMRGDLTIMREED